MGGCASKPRESDPKALPTENASVDQAPQVAEPEVPVQDKVETKEEPLVDVSERTESKAAEPNASAPATAELVQTQENAEPKKEGEQLKETTQEVVKEAAKAPEATEQKKEEATEQKKEVATEQKKETTTEQKKEAEVVTEKKENVKEAEKPKSEADVKK